MKRCSHGPWFPVSPPAAPLPDGSQNCAPDSCHKGRSPEWVFCGPEALVGSDNPQEVWQQGNFSLPSIKPSLQPRRSLEKPEVAALPCGSPVAAVTACPAGNLPSPATSHHRDTKVTAAWVWGVEGGVGGAFLCDVTTETTPPRLNEVDTHRTFTAWFSETCPSGISSCLFSDPTLLSEQRPGPTQVKVTAKIPAHEQATPRIPYQGQEAQYSSQVTPAFGASAQPPPCPARNLMEAVGGGANFTSL